MAAPCGDDLRQKVIKAIDEGMRKSEAARVFNVSHNTIDLWLKRREATGEFKAKKAIKKEASIKLLTGRSFESLL